MADILELLEFKTAVTKMLRTLMEKVDDVQEQVSNLRQETETL